jgi:hypothetical protein
MITEEELRQDPDLVTRLTGIPAETFWQLAGKAEKSLPAYDRQRHERPDRQRAVGGGRQVQMPMVMRLVMLLTYLRQHITQALVAKLCGGTQSDVSRDLRRILPLLKRLLPCPDIWHVTEETRDLTAEEQLALIELADRQALGDATEQQVYRSQDNTTRKAYYSGKKKMFTLKAELVTDGEHHIKAISDAVPGAKNDKKLSDETQTVDRLPDGCHAKADKSYQGVDKQVTLVTVLDTETGESQQVPRLIMETPFKKPKGGELTEEQKLFNHQLNSIRVRVEHCIGRVKNWRIISTRFRCEHSIYTAILQLVCGLVNLQIQRWQNAKAQITT